MDELERKLQHMEEAMAAEVAAAARKQGEFAAEQEASASAFNEAKRLRLAELEKFRCPRCLGFIPNNETPGAYMGALSRTTRGPDDEPIYVCSACGTDEALRQFTDNGKTPSPDEWPLARKFELPLANEIDKLMGEQPDLFDK
jgi:rubrerythrin